MQTLLNIPEIWWNALWWNMPWTVSITQHNTSIGINQQLDAQAKFCTTMFQYLQNLSAQRQRDFFAHIGQQLIKNPQLMPTGKIITNRLDTLVSKFFLDDEVDQVFVRLFEKDWIRRLQGNFIKSRKICEKIFMHRDKLDITWYLMPGSESNAWWEWQQRENNAWATKNPTMSPIQPDMKNFGSMQFFIDWMTQCNNAAMQREFFGFVLENIDPDILVWQTDAQKLPQFFGIKSWSLRALYEQIEPITSERDIRSISVKLTNHADTLNLRQFFNQMISD